MPVLLDESEPWPVRIGMFVHPLLRTIAHIGCEHRVGKSEVQNFVYGKETSGALLVFA